MHERERHKLILNAVQERPVATIGELVEMTATSEATIRRDISALHVPARRRRDHGGETAAMIEAAGVKLIVAETAVRNETLPFPESA